MLTLLSTPIINSAAEKMINITKFRDALMVAKEVLVALKDDFLVPPRLTRSISQFLTKTEMGRNTTKSRLICKLIILIVD